MPTDEVEIDDNPLIGAPTGVEVIDLYGPEDPGRLAGLFGRDFADIAPSETIEKGSPAHARRLAMRRRHEPEFREAVMGPLGLATGRFVEGKGYVCEDEEEGPRILTKDQAEEAVDVAARRTRRSGMTVAEREADDRFGDW